MSTFGPSRLPRATFQAVRFLIFWPFLKAEIALCPRLKNGHQFRARRIQRTAFQQRNERFDCQFEERTVPRIELKIMSRMSSIIFRPASKFLSHQSARENTFHTLRLPMTKSVIIPSDTRTEARSRPRGPRVEAPAWTSAGRGSVVEFNKSPSERRGELKLGPTMTGHRSLIR